MRQSDPNDSLLRPTRFTEANALLAVQEGDTDSAQEHLKSLLPRELRMLGLAATNLAMLCSTEVHRRNREKGE